MFCVNCQGAASYKFKVLGYYKEQKALFKQLEMACRAQPMVTLWRQNEWK